MRSHDGYCLAMPVACDLACRDRRHIAASLHRHGEMTPYAPWLESEDTVYFYGSGSGRILAAFRVTTLLDGESDCQEPDGSLRLDEAKRWLDPDTSGRLYAWLRKETVLPFFVAQIGRRQRISSLAR